MVQKTNKTALLVVTESGAWEAGDTRCSGAGPVEMRRRIFEYIFIETRKEMGLLATLRWPKIVMDRFH